MCFYPLHGHCYWGPLVNGSEGRKDTACSLYSHLEVAPENTYYDFASSLGKYCMNRQAGYFKNTQFFYDISHSYNHTCSEIYSSKYLIHLNSVNSNTWKQFNSYLQRIKSSVKQMSQAHFMFFIKYMIRLWIEKKNQSFKKKLSIALTGSLHSSLIIRLFSLSVLVTCPRCNSFVFCLFRTIFLKLHRRSFRSGS